MLTLTEIKAEDTPGTEPGDDNSGDDRTDRGRRQPRRRRRRRTAAGGDAATTARATAGRRRQRPGGGDGEQTAAAAARRTTVAGWRRLALPQQRVQQQPAAPTRGRSAHVCPSSSRRTAGRSSASAGCSCATRTRRRTPSSRRSSPPTAACSTVSTPVSRRVARDDRAERVPRRVEHRMREPLAEPIEAASPLPDPVAAAAASMDLAALWCALGELPRRQRQAILLREFSGLSYGELAGALAVSEPAVESLLFRARRDLRLRLRPSYSSAGDRAARRDPGGARARRSVGCRIRGRRARWPRSRLRRSLAKLAAGAAAVVVAGGTVAAVESEQAIRTAAREGRRGRRRLPSAAPRPVGAVPCRAVATHRPGEGRAASPRHSAPVGAGARGRWARDFPAHRPRQSSRPARRSRR